MIVRISLRRRWEVVFTASAFDGVLQHGRYFYVHGNAERYAMISQARAPRGTLWIVRERKL